MALIREIKNLSEEMTGWRRHLHAHPELSGTEEKTASFIEEKLASFGYTPERLGSHGVIATLPGKSNASGRAIILRADTDALPIVENTGKDHASQNPGVMHACGHDGHTAMLLGAAKYLKDHPDFDGAVHFLFQPAEETGQGAFDMMQSGLFQKYPAAAIYGLHNAPTFPLGIMGTWEGPMLSQAQGFQVTLSGRGGHASDAADANDLLSASSEIVLRLKKKQRRHIAGADPAGLVITALHTSSTTTNIMSDQIVLLGTIRSYSDADHAALKAFLEETVNRFARTVSAAADVSFGQVFPVVSNTKEETATAIAAARETLSGFNPLERVSTKPRLTLGSEDFSFYLQHKPGNYMAMGTGALKTLFNKSSVEGLHSARYDFNDEALPYGASYWVNLVRTALPPSGVSAPKSTPSGP